MKPYTLALPCCGSAATAVHLLGGRRSIVPYQGSKWRHRRKLESVFYALGFEGPPKVLALNDPGPWGITAAMVLAPTRRAEIVSRLEAMVGEDPATVYDRLNGALVPLHNSDQFAAEHLFLQRLAFSGKSVTDDGGVWRSPGFNRTSAYGKAGTKVFGAIKPMLPSLIGVLRGYDQQIETMPWTFSGRRTLLDVAHGCTPDDDWLVYIDPPYVGTTGFGGSLPRAEVVAAATLYAGAGASVVVSEATPIPELTRLPGWEAYRLDDGRGDTSRFRGQQEEHVTVYRGGRARP